MNPLDRISQPTYLDRIERIIELRKELGQEIDALCSDWADGEFRNSPKRQRLTSELVAYVQNSAGFYGTLDKIRREVPPFN